MEITLQNLKPLKTAVGSVLPAVASRDVKPALKCVKLEVSEGGEIALMATDLEIGVMVMLDDAQIGAAGSALVPAAKLREILHALGDDTALVLQTTENEITLKTATAEFNLPAELPSGFPDFPKHDLAEKCHEIGAGVLVNLIDRTLFAADKETQLRFGATTGVLWECTSDSVRLVTTDGHRLAVAKGAAVAVGGHEVSGSGNAIRIIPAKTMELVRKLAAGLDADTKVLVRIDTNEAHFQLGSATVYTRLVEGRFPTWQSVLPKRFDLEIPLQAGPLYSAVRQAAVMTDAMSSRIGFTFTRGKVTLATQNADVGASRVERAIDWDVEATKQLYLDYHYLTDVLRAVGPETKLAMRLQSADGSPAVLVDTETDYKYVVVPMVANTTS